MAKLLTSILALVLLLLVSTGAMAGTVVGHDGGKAFSDAVHGVQSESLHHTPAECPDGCLDAASPCAVHGYLLPAGTSLHDAGGGEDPLRPAPRMTLGSREPATLLRPPRIA